MNQTKPGPETSIDLQGYFCDALGMKPDQVEQFFEFVDWPKAIGARFKRYLPEGFRELAALVKGWGGEYDRDRRQFTIPKVAKAPSQVPPENIVEGLIERVETVKDWVHVYVANVTRPLAIKPDLATPGLKSGNKIRAEVGIGESWLFINRFDILKEEERPMEPEPAKEVPPSQPYTRLGYYPDFPIDKILSSKFSFRLDIGENISDLMAEIHAAGRIIEPLVCRPHRKLTYVEMGPGERRLLAARNLGLKTVPIIVDNFTDQEFDRIRLLENIARKDLTDYEMARVLDYMLKTYPAAYPMQQALADDFGKTQGWIAQRLRMLELAKDKEVGPIITRVINKVDEGHIRTILEAPEEKRVEVTKYIAEHIEREGALPSMREIKEFVAPTPPEAPEIEKETAIGELRPKPIGEARRAEVPSMGFEPTPIEKPTEVPTPEPIPPGFEPGPPKDVLLDRALHWYQTDLLDFVWERVTIPERRQKFLKVFSAVEHELIVQRGLLEEAWERAKDRFEKPEEVTV